MNVFNKCCFKNGNEIYHHKQRKRKFKINLAIATVSANDMRKGSTLLYL